MKYTNNKFHLLAIATILLAYSNYVFPDSTAIPTMSSLDDEMIYDEGKNVTSLEDANTFSTIVSSGRSKMGHRLLRDLRTNTGSTNRRVNGDRVILNKSINQGNENNVLSAQGSSSTAKSMKYFITDIGTLGGTESFAYGISNSGKVVGSSRLVGDTATHSFLYSNGKMTDLYPLNSGNIQTVGPTSINGGKIASGVISNGIYYPALYDIKTSQITVLDSLGGVTPYNFNGVATSINDSGQAVGYSYLDDINRHAFLYSNGVVTDIGSFGGYSSATAINDKGMIVGFASDLYNGSAHAFFYSNGVMKDIDPVAPLDFSRSESYANDINKHGDVVGAFFTQGQSTFHGFLSSNGVFTDIGVAGSLETYLLGINDRGQIVGIKSDPYNDVCFDPELGSSVPCIKYEQHAFFYAKGKVINLDALIRPNSGWKLSWAFDINNNGQIVGYGLVNDKFRAFLLMPATNEEQCKHGGWKNYGFNYQNECIAFVETDG